MTNLTITYVGTILVSYLFGSIPWALIIGRVFFKTDIREKGSGNLGGSNAGRVLGRKAGVTVMVLDILKSFIAVAIASSFSVQAGALAGIFCTIGHCYPLFANFKGGKAVSTSAGFLLATCIFTGVNWWILIIAVIIFFVTLYLSKFVSLASILAFTSLAITSFIYPTDMIIRITLIALAILVIYRHRQNISRLVNNQENKISWM